MTTMLTPHITYEEMIASQTASRMGIDNTPDELIYANIVETAHLLEAIRSILGNRPILISSGYRSPEVNRVIGGARNSSHMTGKAADFTCPGYGNPRDVCYAISQSGIVFDQLIHEFNSWVHIAWDQNMRQQVLTIDNYGTRLGL